MATRKPLVNIAGQTQELPSSDVMSKASVGLGNVDNTSDAAKPVSAAQAAAIALKMNDAAPAARAESNAPQVIASTTFQKVLLGSEVFDSGFYNPSTSKFMPTISGKYFAVGSISFQGSVTAGSRLIAAVTKNGVVVENATSPATNQPTNNIQHCAMFDMNGTTDYIELYARQDSGVSMTISNTSATNMIVYRIGS